MQKNDPFHSSTIRHFFDLISRYGAPIVALNLIRSVEKKPREMILKKGLDTALKFITARMEELKKEDTLEPPLRGIIFFLMTLACLYFLSWTYFLSGPYLPLFGHLLTYLDYTETYPDIFSNASSAFKANTSPPVSSSLPTPSATLAPSDSMEYIVYLPWDFKKNSKYAQSQLILILTYPYPHPVLTLPLGISSNYLRM